MQATTETTPSELTRHGVKSLCEAKDLAADLQGVQTTLQVVDFVEFGEDRKQKHIKARATLSDGVSKLTCMISEPLFN